MIWMEGEAMRGLLGLGLLLAGLLGAVEVSLGVETAGGAASQGVEAAAPLPTTGCWRIVPGIGGPAPDAPYLWAVAARAANDVWAIGDRGATLHWAGGAWSVVPSPALQWL